MAEKIGSEKEITGIPRKTRKKLIALIAAGALLLVGGVTTTLVMASNAAYAEETETLCAVDLEEGIAAKAQAVPSLPSAKEFSKAVEDGEAAVGAIKIDTVREDRDQA